MKFEKRNQKNIERTNRYTRKINQKEDLIRKSNKKSKQKNRHHKQVRERKNPQTIQTETKNLSAH